MLDLLFGAAPESPASVSTSRPWTDPLTRQPAAALLNLYLTSLSTGCGCMAMLSPSSVGWGCKLKRIGGLVPLFLSEVAYMVSDESQIHHTCFGCSQSTLPSNITLYRGRE